VDDAPVAHGVSISMDASFCMEALQEAFSKYGQPEIFNSDQGSQFTSEEFTEALNERGVAISMDGKGAWRDNIFVERFWRSIKYEEIYLHACDSVSQAKAGISRYIDFYNAQRPHSSLDKQTPGEFHFATLPAIIEAGVREGMPSAGTRSKSNSGFPTAQPGARDPWLPLTL
jgi:putative transposase